VKYYIASGLPNFARVNQAAAALNAAGHERTYDWTVHCDIRAEGPGRMRSVSSRELGGVMDADLVLVLMPGGKGTHTELGAALASAELGRKKRILLWSETGREFDAGEGRTDENVCAFYFHPEAERLCCSFEELLDRLREMQCERPFA